MIPYFTFIVYYFICYSYYFFNSLTISYDIVTTFFNSLIINIHHLDTCQRFKNNLYRLERMSMYIGNNTIALQSREWLVQALISLMQEHPYNKITIKEICTKADLSRSYYNG